MPKSNQFIAFDMEGPLTPEDSAYDFMSLVPCGQHLFEVISYYDDILALEGKEDYQPGYTLALIAPFLIRHGISACYMAEQANNAPLTPGAPELIENLREEGWQVFCITTAYSPFALGLARRLGIQPDRVASTVFPENAERIAVSREDAELLDRFTSSLFASPQSIVDLREKLDHFFFRELPQTTLGRITAKIAPVGGKRKEMALARFAQSCNQPLDSWVVVGDSITDKDMLRSVDQAGGLAVAFNANKYAIPYATMAMAATSIAPLRRVLVAWTASRREGVKRLLAEEQFYEHADTPVHLSWISEGEAIEDIIRLGEQYRRLMRSKAGELG